MEDGMKLTLREVEEILQKEINWCLDNPDNELSEHQQVGFMNGLRQAQTLIRDAERVLLLSEPVGASEIPARLVPLANVAKELKDEDIQECIKFAAYLNYRQRIFKMAEDELNKFRPKP
jgi:hypothetical protein